jgi:hypothetical protein
MMTVCAHQLFESGGAPAGPRGGEETLSPLKLGRFFPFAAGDFGTRRPVSFPAAANLIGALRFT